MPLKAKLVVVGGDTKTEEIKLRLPSTVGRGRGTTIMLAHPLVSRQHCELYEANGQLMVRDLGSLNGTFVNNQRVSEAPLPPGELLTIGTVTFRAVYEAESEGGPPAESRSQPKSANKGASSSAETIRATAPKPKAPSQTPAAEEEIEFNFEKPLMPLDEDIAADSDAMHTTGRLEANVAEAPNPKAAPPGKKPASKPAAAKPAAPAAPPAKPGPMSPGDAATIDFAKGEAADDDDEEKVESAEDDDLDDFLKSLGK
jgi:predicted component of type VI protein secretion system